LKKLIKINILIILIRQKLPTSNFCRIFVPKLINNGKKISSVRLGDEATAPQQGQLRYFGRLLVGVAP
jgi:hypothetical protein